MKAELWIAYDSPEIPNLTRKPVTVDLPDNDGHFDETSQEVFDAVKAAVCSLLAKERDGASRPNDIADPSDEDVHELIDAGFYYVWGDEPDDVSEMTVSMEIDP